MSFPTNAPYVGANLVFARDVNGEINDAIIAIIVGDHKDRPYNAMISMRIMESAVVQPASAAKACYADLRKSLRSRAPKSAATACSVVSSR